MLIELSSACNSDCKHCFRNKNRNHHMSYYAFRTIVDSVKQFGAWDRLYLSGQGESLMNPDIWKCLAYSKALGFRNTISTNTKLVNNENVDMLTSLCDEIQVSIDSLWNYELRDQEPQNIIDKIDLINSRLREGNGFQVNVLISEDNINELPEILERLDTNFSMEILQLQHSVIHPNFKNEWDQNKKMLERMPEILEIVKPHREKIIYWEMGGSYSTCFSRKKDLCVTADQYLVPCAWRLDPEDFYIDKMRLPIQENFFSKEYYEFINDPEVYLPICEPCMEIDRILGRKR